MRAARRSLLLASLLQACSGDGEGTGGAPSASADPSSGYGEVTFQHLAVRIQAPPEIRSAVEVPNKADSTGKTYQSTINLGTTLEPIEIRLLNDPIVVPVSLDAIKKDAKNTQVEKLPTGAVAYLRGDEPTVWLSLAGKPGVTCALSSKKTEASVALAWRICKTLRPNDG